jgi:hypothetical protein
MDQIDSAYNNQLSVSYTINQDRNLGRISISICVRLCSLVSTFHFEGNGNHKYVD